MDFKMAVWNIKGINNELKQKDAMNMLRGEKLQFCAFIETHLKTKSIKKVGNRVFGNWNWFSNVHHSPTSYRIMMGWNTNMIRTMVIIGDFNVTLNVEEHSAGMSHRNIDMQEFHDVVNKLEIKDICTSGFQYTWTKSLKNTNCLILKRLDRIMVNDEFMKLVKKMKTLKKPLKALSWSHGNVYDRVRALKDELNSKQKDADENPFDLKIKTIAAQTLNEYIEASKDELSLLQQKAKIQWLKKGYKNTDFFHNMIKAKRNKSRVESIKDEYRKVYEGRNVAEQFVLHFKKFLGEYMPVTNIEEDLFINKINNEYVVKMTGEVTNDEIKSAIFYSDSNKASGPDGFSPEFFKKAWEVIGNDVCLAVKDLFRSGKILGEINATLIALIPKINTPSKVSDFRPIACCNVIYKCISKILTNRIKNGLSKIVNINQSAFIPGRHI
ncbi:RNA-directed DNA polymerase, eukaryota, reverse transcriptase zinc-binding domain protein [Tanacetum coccineum]